jgi:hypothetical protein
VDAVKKYRDRTILLAINFVPFDVITNFQGNMIIFASKKFAGTNMLLSVISSYFTKGYIRQVVKDVVFKKDEHLYLFIR